MTLTKFIAGLPKAERHSPIEGGLDCAQMERFAWRDTVNPVYKNDQVNDSVYRHKYLQGFLNLFNQGVRVLQARNEFYDVTYAYLKRVYVDVCLWVETFFVSQVRRKSGVSCRGVGLKTTANSDHPSYFGGNINDCVQRYAEMNSSLCP